MSSAKVVISAGNASKIFVGADKFEVTQQEATLHTSDGQVRKFKVSLDSTQPPYAPGEYSISDVSFSVTQYGALSLVRNIVLEPLKASGVSSLSKAS